MMVDSAVVYFAFASKFGGVSSVGKLRHWFDLYFGGDYFPLFQDLSDEKIDLEVFDLTLTLS